MTRANIDWSRWEKNRRKGFARVVLVYGVLLWGLSTGVLFSLIFPLFMPGIEFRAVWPLAIPGFALGGLFWGAAFWFLMEWQYRRAHPQIQRQREET